MHRLSTPEFDPQQYKSFQSLPDDQKRLFKELDDGNFCSRDSADHEEWMTRVAAGRNKGRRLIDKLLDRNKTRPIDELHEEAFSIDARETRLVAQEREIQRVIESMPEELKAKLREAIFEGSEKDREGEKIISAKGLDGAIEAAQSSVKDNRYHASMETALVYHDQDTSATVTARDNGHYHVYSEDVRIVYKEVEYAWKEILT